MNNLKDALEFIREMGESIAQSGMFGCESKYQGHVIAWACLARGRDLLTLAETYHIMAGKLSKKADAMLAEYNRRGGHHMIVERSPDAAEITCVNPGTGYTRSFRLTWEDAAKEPFTKKKDGSVSANYSTPRKRMQMLWARVVSDAVRAMMPEAVAGAYTPEESEEWAGFKLDEVKIATEEVRFEPTAKTPATTTFALAAPPEDKPKPSGVTFSASDSAPVADSLVGEIKAAIKELSQVDGYSDIASRVKRKLHDSGLEKLDQLTHREATDLLSAIRVKVLDAFFTASLAGHGREGNVAAS